MVVVLLPHFWPILHCLTSFWVLCTARADFFGVYVLCVHVQYCGKFVEVDVLRAMMVYIIMIVGAKLAVSLYQVSVDGREDHDGF